MSKCTFLHDNGDNIYMTVTHHQQRTNKKKNEIKSNKTSLKTIQKKKNADGRVSRGRKKNVTIIQFDLFKAEKTTTPENRMNL